jgi:hypothetical protein
MPDPGVITIELKFAEKRPDYRDLAHRRSSTSLAFAG